MTLKVKRLTSTAKLPTKGSEMSAGYDLSACLFEEDGTPRCKRCLEGKMLILPGDRVLIPTGLAITVPEGTYGRIGPRSGLAVKNGLDTLAGIVDRDYTDEVGIVLINLGKETFVVEQGMRVAQLVLEKIETPNIEEVDEIGLTQRTGGFGSTGL